MNLLINIVYDAYIDLYIHIYIPNQAIRVAKLGFYCLFFSLKKNTKMLMSRDLDFDLELEFLRNPYIYVSSACIPNSINMAQRKLWEILMFIKN